MERLWWSMQRYRATTCPSRLKKQSVTIRLMDASLPEADGRTLETLASEKYNNSTIVAYYAYYVKHARVPLN